MEQGKIHAMAAMLAVLCLFWGQYMMKGVQANIAAVEEEFCLENCIKSCRSGGISPLRCFKYCERHCGAQASARKSPSLHYCKLGCMRDKCAKFHDDEGKQESCVADCETNVCLVG